MKIIGVIGGMSWESTYHYYKLMNQYIAHRLGPHFSIEAMIYSLNFSRIFKLFGRNDWQGIARELSLIAKKLENSGADFLMITSNTAHKVADQLDTSLPLLHIVDPTADAIRQKGLKKVGLLGTRVTMEDPFYTDRLTQHQIEVIVPERGEIDPLDRIIFEELTHGIIKQESKKIYQDVIDNLSRRGAEGVILGCTELPLLLQQKDVDLPLFDTTLLHAHAAVELTIKEVE